MNVKISNEANESASNDLSSDHYDWLERRLGNKVKSMQGRAFGRDRSAMGARSVRRPRRGTRSDLAASFDAERSTPATSGNSAGPVKDSNSRWARAPKKRSGLTISLAESRFKEFFDQPDETNSSQKVSPKKPVN